MEKDFLLAMVIGLFLFMGLGLFIGFKAGTNKYKTYYHYYMSQYTPLETINKVQDLSTPN